MQEAKKILLLGAGGHCLSILDSLLSAGDFLEIGIVDNQYRSRLDHARTVDGLLGIPIVGADEDLPALKKAGYTHAFVAIGSIGEVTVRQKLYSKVKEIGFIVPNIIDPTSIVSQSASLKEGVFIGKYAVINAGVSIDEMAIINTASVIEHECHIGAYAHVAPGSILSGNVHIGAHTHIGAGSVIKQGIDIGYDSMIGMGSVVLSSVGNQTTAYGNPCREVKK